MDGPDEITTALGLIDRKINSVGAAIRRMPDRKRNTRVHLDMLKERRRLMTVRDGLIARQCGLALMN